MKYWLRRLLIAVAAFSLLGGTALAQNRIGTVDLQKVFENYHKRKQADAALKELVADLEKDDRALRETYKNNADAYQKLRDDANDTAVSAAEREKRKKLAEDKLKDLKDHEETIRTYGMNARTRIEEQRRRARESILVDIRKAIDAKAKSTGYSLVIDVSAKSGNSTIELISMALNRQDATEEHLKSTTVVLYSSGDNDLTTPVLDQLNAGAPIEPGKAVEKKDEKKDAKK